MSFTLRERREGQDDTAWAEQRPLDGRWWYIVGGLPHLSGISRVTCQKSITPCTTLLPPLKPSPTCLIHPPGAAFRLPSQSLGQPHDRRHHDEDNSCCIAPDPAFGLHEAGDVVRRAPGHRRWRRWRFSRPVRPQHARPGPRLPAGPPRLQYHPGHSHRKWRYGRWFSRWVYQ